MAHGYLMPECVVHSDGCGDAYDLGAPVEGTVRLVLHVTHTVSRECLVVSVLGSTDGRRWHDKPLAHFPQNCLNGDYETTVHLDGVRYLRAEWAVKRWERTEAPAVFGFSLELADLALAISAAG